jgi:hypothetical protein
MVSVRGMNGTAEEFRSWLSDFGINYKNYIRFTEIKRVLNDSKNL